MATRETQGKPSGRGGARRAPAAEERRRDPERTKAKILDAAVTEFAAHGYAGTRVADIARRAGVNQQLIAYYFDGKQGLYREIGRSWRGYEQQTFTADMGFAEQLRKYVEVSVGADGHNGKLLAWAGLEDTGADDADAEERNARLAEEVETFRQRQAAGEVEPDADAAAMLLIGMSAGNALAVYPHLARALFGADADSPEVVRRYADQLAALLTRVLTTQPPS